MILVGSEFKACGWRTELPLINGGQIAFQTVAWQFGRGKHLVWGRGPGLSMRSPLAKGWDLPNLLCPELPSFFDFQQIQGGSQISFFFICWPP